MNESETNRANFEAWLKDRIDASEWNAELTAWYFTRREDGNYVQQAPRDRWEAWQAARAIPAGWALVPIAPTREMWQAVNKLDNEMAAGNYSGQGCTIEQAWECLIEHAPAYPGYPAPAANNGKAST